jgi:hypothetical protein
MEEYAREIAPEGWDVESDSILITPCGCAIEWDGQCPHGIVSFIRQMGAI